MTHSVTPEVEKLKMKIGEAEMEVEGTTDTVNARLETFAALVREHLAATPKSQTIAPATGKLVTNGAEVSTMQAGASSASGEGLAEVPDEVLSRVFRHEDDSVSLLALPTTDEPAADALIALLYAHQRLLNKPNVTGVTLMSAARQSGVSLSRVDTVLNRSDLVMSAGVKRGRRYSLNNRGKAYAEGLIRKMVE